MRYFSINKSTYQDVMIYYCQDERTLVSYMGNMEDTEKQVCKALSERIVILDGGMSTTLRTYGLGETEVRGSRFAKTRKDLLNNCDILNITRPELIEQVHRDFFVAGSDICSTNTFSANVIAQSEFFDEAFELQNLRRKDEDYYAAVLADEALQELCGEMNYEAVKICRQAADKCEEQDGKKRFVAGALGPLTVSLSAAVDSHDTAFRSVSFDQVKTAYRLQISSLLEAGCDILLLETIFDSLNAKAAVVAMQEIFAERDKTAPLIISAAIGRGGETIISAQKIEAFWNTFAYLEPLAIGLNCSFGPDLMRPYLEELGDLANTHISCYPNAGLPNPLSPTGFELGVEEFERSMSGFAKNHLLNLVGGCCGTTPKFIKALTQAVAKFAPRQLRS